MRLIHRRVIQHHIVSCFSIHVYPYYLLTISLCTLSFPLWVNPILSSRPCLKITSSVATIFVYRVSKYPWRFSITDFAIHNSANPDFKLCHYRVPLFCAGRIPILSQTARMYWSQSWLRSVSDTQSWGYPVVMVRVPLAQIPGDKTNRSGYARRKIASACACLITTESIIPPLGINFPTELDARIVRCTIVIEIFHDF